MQDQLTTLRSSLDVSRFDTSADRDLRHYSRIATSSINFYADVSPLTPQHIADDAIDWTARRAWFNESVKAARRRDLENGFSWSGVPESQAEPGCYDDSYRGMDYELWESRQPERDCSVTLARGYQIQDGMREDAVLATLDQIVMTKAVER